MLSSCRVDHLRLLLAVPLGVPGMGLGGESAWLWPQLRSRHLPPAKRAKESRRRALPGSSRPSRRITLFPESAAANTAAVTHICAPITIRKGTSGSRANPSGRLGGRGSRVADRSGQLTACGVRACLCRLSLAVARGTPAPSGPSGPHAACPIARARRHGQLSRPCFSPGCSSFRAPLAPRPANQSGAPPFRSAPPSRTRSVPYCPSRISFLFARRASRLSLFPGRARSGPACSAAGKLVPLWCSRWSRFARWCRQKHGMQVRGRVGSDLQRMEMIPPRAGARLWGFHVWRPWAQEASPGRSGRNTTAAWRASI